MTKLFLVLLFSLSAYASNDLPQKAYNRIYNDFAYEYDLLIEVTDCHQINSLAGTCLVHVTDAQGSNGIKQIYNYIIDQYGNEFTHYLGDVTYPN